MSTDSNKPVTFTNETIDKHFADERAAYKLSRVHDRVRADAIEVFNRTGKTPSQLAERLEEAEKLLRETQGIVQMLMDILRELPDDTDYEGMEVERPLPLAKASMKRVRAFLTRTTNG